MKIGNVELKNNVILAPMAGVTDYAFRKICEDCGVAMVCSEMVSAKGLYYKDKKTKELLKGQHNAVYSVQIFGSEPDIIKEVSAEAAEYGDILDINMGCPTPKIVNNGDGSALLKNPKLAGKIVSAAVCSTNKPVTVKMRIGWQDGNDAVEIAKELEANGAAAITVHGRTRMQFYSGKAGWNVISDIVKAVKIPIIGNGDVVDLKSYNKIQNITGCSGVMVGRACEGNPFIFSELTDNNFVNPSERERLDMALKHLKLLVETKGEPRGIKEARKHIAWYIKGMRDSGALKLNIFKSTKYQEMADLINDFYDRVYKQ